MKSLFNRKSADDDLTPPRYLRFNLLPEDYLNRRKRKAFRVIRVLLLVLVLAGVAGLTAYQVVLLRNYEAAEEEAMQEIKQYEEALQLEQELLATRAEYQQRQDLIMGTALYVDINMVMEDVAASVPSAVTLNSLYVEKDGGLIITGVADTLHQVSHFASVLRDDIEYLPEPTVTFPSRIQPEGTPERIGFRMNADWDGGGE